MGRVIAIIAVEKEVHPQMAIRMANDGSPPNDPSPINYYHLSSIAMSLLSTDSYLVECALQSTSFTECRLWKNNRTQCTGEDRKTMLRERDQERRGEREQIQNIIGLM